MNESSPILRATGWKPSTPERMLDASKRFGFSPLKPIDHGALIGAYSKQLPEKCRPWESMRVPCRDQFGSSCCVGFSLTRAIYLRLLLLGHKPEHPSPVLPYTGARALAREDKHEPLIDDGCDPALAVEALRRWGIVGESAFPFDEDRINEEPTLDVFEEASAHVIKGISRVTTKDEDALGLAMRQSIAAGFPVSFGRYVGQNFMSYGTKKNDSSFLWTVDESRNGGGHMMLCVGYERFPNGDYAYDCDNSWGESWGLRGSYRAGIEWFTHSSCDDIFIVSL